MTSKQELFRKSLCLNERKPLHSLPMTLLEYLLEDALFYLLNSLGFVLVVLVTWLWTRFRAVRLERDYQTRLHALRMQYEGQWHEPVAYLAEQRERLRRLVYGMRQALQQNNLQQLQQYRHQLSHALILDYLPAANRLWTALAPFEGSRPSAAWVEAQILPVLETCRQTLAALNAPTVRKALPQATEVVLEQKDLGNALTLLRQAKQTYRAKAYGQALDLS